MNRPRLSIWIQCIVVALLIAACANREERERAERLRLWQQDSLSQVRVQDSLELASFQSKLSQVRRMLLDSLELRGPDCMRFSVIFGWPTVAGPCISISPCKEGDNYLLYVNAFKWRNHDDFERIAAVKRITEEDYSGLSSLLDSFQFEDAPLHSAPHDSLDIQVFDGDHFLIERRRTGTYHGIARYTPPDLVVYDLFASASELAELPESVGQSFLSAKEYWERDLKRRRLSGDSVDGI
jgi:hypothetical protein